MEVAHSNLETLTVLGFSSTVNFFRIFRGHFFYPENKIELKVLVEIFERP